MNRAVNAAPDTLLNTSQTPEPAETAPVLSWHVVGAAVQGVSHLRMDLPCQDAQGYRLLPDGTLVIALADGAGSARYSAEGARAAVDEALEALSGALLDGPPSDREGWENLLRDTYTAAREAVFSLVDAQGLTISAREYAATLTCVVASSSCIAVGQIGDGAVAAVDEADGLFAVTQLQRGEYANETHFITEANALDELTVEIIDGPINALAVMSDGLIRLALKMPAQEPFVPFFQPLFRFASTVEDEAAAVQQLTDFLNSERVNARTDDDKSLVLAVRSGVQVNQLVVKPRPVSLESETQRESLDSSQDSAGKMETISSGEETLSEEGDTLGEGDTSIEEISSLDQEGE